MIISSLSQSFVRCFAVEGSMRSVEVVEAFPFVEFGFQIDISFVAEKLIEYLTVGSA